MEGQVPDRGETGTARQNEGKAGPLAPHAVTSGPTPPAYIEITPVDPAHADAAWRLNRYFDELDRRFKAGFDHSLGAGEGGNAYTSPNGMFVLARTLEGPVACGGVPFVATHFAEIKRIWVS
ncbi:MAG: hypothetical protein VW713_03915 [Alphaproteobacteria bacterium]